MRAQPLIVLLLAAASQFAHGQHDDKRLDADEPPAFEVYTLASAMHTVDATPTLVIHNPSPNQDLGFSPNGNASGARLGLVWRNQDIGLIADFGFHKYADRTGSMTLVPLMAGIRFYSHEQFRTTFFGEAVAGAYRWSVHASNMKCTAVKAIAGAGGGVDISVSRTVAIRLFEIQVLLAGARTGPLLTGTASTGLAWRF